jgi:hypothetical protein
VEDFYPLKGDKRKHPFVVGGIVVDTTAKVAQQ